MRREKGGRRKEGRKKERKNEEARGKDRRDEEMETENRQLSGAPGGGRFGFDSQLAQTRLWNW